MPLITCPECSHYPVSDRADSCPQCGCPIAKEQVDELKDLREKLTGWGAYLSGDLTLVIRDPFYVNDIVEVSMSQQISKIQINSDIFHDEDFTPVSKMNSVQIVSFFSCEHITDRTLDVLSKMTQIETISLSFCHSEYLTHDAICRLSTLPNLRELTLPCAMRTRVRDRNNILRMWKLYEFFERKNRFIRIDPSLAEFKELVRTFNY